MRSVKSDLESVDSLDELGSDGPRMKGEVTLLLRTRAFSCLIEIPPSSNIPQHVHNDTSVHRKHVSCKKTMTVSR